MPHLVSKLLRCHYKVARREIDQIDKVESKLEWQYNAATQYRARLQLQRAI